MAVLGPDVVVAVVLLAGVALLVVKDAEPTEIVVDTSVQVVEEAVGQMGTFVLSVKDFGVTRFNVRGMIALAALRSYCNHHGTFSGLMHTG